jgi:hypothetical protein
MLTFLSFLKLNSILLCRCTMLSLSIHLRPITKLGYCEQCKSLWHTAFTCFGWIPRTGIAGSYVTLF